MRGEGDEVAGLDSTTSMMKRGGVVGCSFTVFVDWIATNFCKSEKTGL